MLPSVPPAPDGEVTVTGWARRGEASRGKEAAAGTVASINLPEALRRRVELNADQRLLLIALAVGYVLSPVDLLPEVLLTVPGLDFPVLPASGLGGRVDRTGPRRAGGRSPGSGRGVHGLVEDLAELVVELGPVELAVDTARGDEFGVGAALDDASLVDDEDEVGMPDRGQAVRDHQG